MKLKRQTNLIKTIGQCKSGFTLVELMVVVAVISILVAIAVPVYNTQAEQTKDSVDEANLRILNSVTSIYRFNKYGDDPFLDSSKNSEQLMALLVPVHLAEKPIPQKPGNSYEWDFNKTMWILTGSINENVESADAISNDYLLIVENKLRGFIEEYFEVYAKAEKLELIIPDNLGIKMIEDRAFFEKNIKIDYLSLPGSITSIGHHAFEDIGLKELNLVAGIQEIKNRAFRNNQLSKLIIPESVTSIGSESFRNNNITELSIPSNINIKQNAFLGNPLNRIEIGSNVKIEHNNSFNNLGNFKILYDDLENGGAGIYNYAGGTWIKE